ncbi:Dihydroneopterin aldolase [Candidatus Entotheonellaceae bacterium PAL068K]
MGRDVIRLGNMLFYGHHGVNPEEQKLGQRFEVDVELRLDTRPAALQDDLRLTINYAQVYRAVKRIVEEECFALIETLAETIAMHLGQHFAPDSVRVCVRKPHAPVKGVLDCVAIEIERTQEAWQ